MDITWWILHGWIGIATTNKPERDLQLFYSDPNANKKQSTLRLLESVRGAGRGGEGVSSASSYKVYMGY